MFELNGIRLRKIDRGDLEIMLELKQDTWMFTHRITIANMDNQKCWYESLLKTSTTCPTDLVLIAEQKERRPKRIGDFKILGIDWINRSANVGWDLFAESRRQGLGHQLVQTGVVYCFKVLNLRRLTAEILETNIASKKCAESAGFQQEGIKRDAVCKQQNMINSIVYGRLDTDPPFQAT